MLKILINGQDQVIQCDDYYVRQLANGLDEVIFNVSIYDPLYPYITEEAKVTDIDGQTYLVKQIDAGKNDAKVICQLNLNDWKKTMYVAWGNGIKNLITTLRMITPSGWTIVNHSTSTELLSVNGSLTALEICAEICDTYDVYIRWNNYTKTVTVLDKVLQPSVGAFVTRELNMTELNYKGKSNDIVTRLYAYGEDDLSFKSINGGKPYVDDFRYTSEVICGYWKDERYKYPETLMAAAKKKLAGICVPERSYSCSVVDLKASDPEKYGFLDFSMFTTATLIDDIKGFSMDYQVVERHTYPYYPEKNEVIFDSAPQRITRELNNTKELLSQKTDASQVRTEIDRATGVLQTGKSGYVVIGRNSDGYANEIYFLDQPSLDDARKVLRINRAGIGFSSNGVGGPYYQAWTMDGILSLGGTNNAYGELHILDGSGNVIGRWSKDGIYAKGGSLQFGQNFSVDTSGNLIAKNGTFTGGTITIGTKFKVDRNGNLTANDGTFTGGTINIGTKFKVDRDGNLTATDGKFTGDISGSKIEGSKILGSEIGTTDDEFYVVSNGDEVEIGFSGFDCWDKILRTNWIGDVENPATGGDDAGINGRTGNAGFKKLYLLDGWYEGSDGSMWDVTRTIRWLDNRLRNIEEFCASHNWDGEEGGGEGDDPGSGGDDGYIDDGPVY